MPDYLVSYFWSGDTLRSRSVGEVVLTGTVDIPEVSTRLMADWQRDIGTRMNLEPGDVEAMPLARARTRWPDYRFCVQALSKWMDLSGLQQVLASSDVALMACRGARYHHDGAQYGGAAFCNLFLSEDKGLDLHFASLGLRIPLVRGTVVVFDTCQPHAVVRRSRGSFDAADFPQTLDCTQLFLTWELPVENTPVGQALQIAFDIDQPTVMLLDEEQVWRNGAPVSVCPDSGHWRQPGISPL